MRKEYYFNLKFFQDYIPHIREIDVVEGITTEENVIDRTEETINILTGNDDLTRILIQDCTHTEISEAYYITTCNELFRSEKVNLHNYSVILPIELRTVAESLYALRQDQEYPEIAEKYEGRKREIRRYFDSYLTSFDNTLDAIRVLYSLSVSPRSKRGLSINMMSKITNISVERVRSVINYFSGHDSKIKPHLVCINNEFDWKHDFYAEQFHDISGGLLDPIDRDNINFFWANKDYLKNDSGSAHQEADNKIRTGELLSFSLFIASLLLLFGRTLLPFFKNIIPLNDTQLFNFQLYFSIGDIFNLRNIDASFALIAVSLTMWSWYVTSLYRKLLSELGERKFSFQRITSKFVAFWSFLCVVFTILTPSLWLMYTGIGGLAVGLKFKQITKRVPGISYNFDETSMKRLWKETVVNSSIMAFIFGPAYALLYPPFSLLPGISAEALYFITCGIMIVMVYFAWLVIKDHTSHKMVPLYIGIYKRYKFLTGADPSLLNRPKNP